MLTCFYIFIHIYIIIITIISKIRNCVIINSLKYVFIIKKILKLNKQILNVYQDLK